MSDIMTEEIQRRFRHYPPRTQEEIDAHEQIRMICKEAAMHLMQVMSVYQVQSREFSMVLTDLENAMMHANAAFARNKE